MFIEKEENEIPKAEIDKFKEWFKTNLLVSRFPLPQECEKMDFDVIINVSDEFIQGCMTYALRSGKTYFWFPMNECTSDIGLNSIYGALQIIFNAEKENKRVYLHCHAGVNRSPTVADCYYFMRTCTHWDESRDMLKMNIKSGNLPAENKMENFLKKCAETFEMDETYRGGMLDSNKLKSLIQ